MTPRSVPAARPVQVGVMEPILQMRQWRLGEATSCPCYTAGEGRSRASGAGLSTCEACARPPAPFCCLSISFSVWGGRLALCTFRLELLIMVLCVFSLFSRENESKKNFLLSTAAEVLTLTMKATEFMMLHFSPCLPGILYFLSYCFFLLSMALVFLPLIFLLFMCLLL